MLKEICVEMYGDETLLWQLQCSLLDLEAKAAATSNRRNLILNFEKEIKKAFYRDEDDAFSVAESRIGRITNMTEAFDDDELVD